MAIARWIGRVAVATVMLLPTFLLTATAQEPQSQFVPADSLPQEVLPATPFVFVAYAFVWVALMVYVYALWRRLGRVERELAEVNAKLAARR